LGLGSASLALPSLGSRSLVRKPQDIGFSERPVCRAEKKVE